MVICPTTSYATSCVACASADCHPAEGVFDRIDRTYGGAPGKAVDVPPRQRRTKEVPDTTGRRRAERQEIPKEATIILLSPPDQDHLVRSCLSTVCYVISLCLCIYHAKVDKRCTCCRRGCHCSSVVFVIQNSHQQATFSM